MMPKARRSKPKRSQHDKFFELARASGADESETAFVTKIKAISSISAPKAAKPKRKK